MKFKEYSFKDLLVEIVDNRGKTCPTAKAGIPLIATNCIKNDSLYPVFEKVRYADQDTYDNWFRGHPKPGDMIFVCKGSPGRVAWVPDPINFCIAQDMVAIRADRLKIYPKYLFALLRSNQTQKKILNMHVGTLIPHFKKGDFGNLFFDIPEDLDYQKKVGDAYYSFCEKIELNRQTNQTLEQIAQAIFKSWFVDFEPVKAKAQVRASVAAGRMPGTTEGIQEVERSREPEPSNQKSPLPKDFDVEAAVERAAMCAISGKSLEDDVQGSTNAAGAGRARAALEQLEAQESANVAGGTKPGATSPSTFEQLKTTAALFPDALVESELGEIPEGWCVVYLKDLAVKISKGTTPSKKAIAGAQDKENIPFLKVRNISNDGEITRTGLDKIPDSVHIGVLKRSVLETNDLLFSIAGTIGRVALIEEDLNNSNCNQAIAFVRLKEPGNHLELCRLNLASNRVQDEVISKVVQGVQANFSLTGLGEIKIILASQNTLDAFNGNIGSIVAKQRLLLNENRRLSELRDVLLPKLLSGELEIGKVA